MVATQAKRPAKVGILCEFSGVTRDAFIALGHDAISCDILPTEQPGPHIQGDCLSQDWSDFDLLICHPPCTYLTFAGNAHWNAPGRAEKRADAMRFFMALYNLPCPRVCVENPLGLPNREFRPPDQTVNPFDFGEPIRKRTCLWLRGLPLLVTGTSLFNPDHKRCEPPAPIYTHARKATGKPKHHYHTDAGAGVASRRVWHWTESVSPSKNRAHERSRSFVSIAAAMAAQWGAFVSTPQESPRAN